MTGWGERVELLLGEWVDITGDVYDRDPITITRGRSAEGTVTERSTCTLTLNNRDGTYSPRNPRGEYYGQLGRNTQLRVSIPAGATYARVSGAAGDLIGCPDAAAFDVGDLDVRVDVTTPTWGVTATMMGRYVTAGDQRCWSLEVAGGHLQLLWSPDGTLAPRVDVVSTDPVPVTGGRLAVRATLDVNNGAGGWTVTFYTADTLAGSWTQLGDPVTGTGATAVFAGAVGLEIGDVTDRTIASLPGRYHAAQVRNGIGGTIVANPDFTVQTAGGGAFVDSAGILWTLEGGVTLDDRDYRFHGEVPAWPQYWDKSGRDIHVKIAAAGILRRLGQGASPLRSALRRQLAENATDIVAYWPMEDGPSATSFASAIAGAPPLRIESGTPQPGTFDSFVGSAPIVTMKDARLLAAVPAYSDTGETQLRMLLALPEDLGTTALLVRLYTTGAGAVWDLWYAHPSQNPALTVYDVEGVQVYSSITTLFTNGELARISLELTQNGGDVDWRMATLEQGLGNPAFFVDGTIPAITVGVVRHVAVASGLLGDTALGHITLSNQISSTFDVLDEFNAFTGEEAADRAARLTDENAVPLTLIGDPGASAAMGPQRIATLLDLVRECETADLGVLHEPRDALALAYRTRTSMYSQTPAVVLDYAAQQVTDDMLPVDDDQATRNDVEVRRDGGSSARALLVSGPLSVQAPPDGVGRYDESVELNVADDDQLADQAAWRLHLGTWDEARYPVLTVNLASPHIDEGLAADLLALDVGDRITVTNPPEWLPPGDIRQLVAGYTETITLSQYRLRFNLTPAGPWQVGVAAPDADAADRADTDASTLASPVSADGTSLSVATTGGRWTTDAANLPVDILVGGEVMTLTAVTGGSSPQTFTVVRGMSIAHPAGAEVRLAYRAFVAL